MERDGDFLPNRECIEAKIEVTVRNGEITFTPKELETVLGALRPGGGQGKIAYFLVTGCRILISPPIAAHTKVFANEASRGSGLAPARADRRSRP
jgi:hypothetical protein